jgi:hypothetical protein
MQARTRWTSDTGKDGIQQHRMRTWRDFFDFVETVVFAAGLDVEPTYIWRGQRDSRWTLDSSLDRLFVTLKLLPTPDLNEIEKESRAIAEAFQHGARGRRGQNPKELSPNEWWALGQHHGLATPLLDWTRSPFAALYFAFEESPAKDQSEHRVVYALDRRLVEQANVTISNEPEEEGFSPTLSIIDPLSDDNPRLVSQGGVLTRGPVGVSVENWVNQHFAGSTKPVMLRIEIPDSDRLSCLRGLDRMNINHLSLFPDLTGAARYVNLRAELAARRKS